MRRVRQSNVALDCSTTLYSYAIVLSRFIPIEKSYTERASGLSRRSPLAASWRALEPARRVGSAGSRSTCRTFVTRYPSLHVTNHHPRRAHRHRRRLAGAGHALHSAVVADALSRASKMRRRRNSDGARDHARTHDIARGVRVTRATPYLGKSVCARATNVFSPSRGADRRVDAATRRHPTDTDRRRRARGRSVRKIRTRRSIGARRAVARLSRHRHFDMRVESLIIDRRCRVSVSYTHLTLPTILLV